MAKAKLSDLRTQKRNANKHTPRGLGMLAEAIGKDGWIGAVTVAADGETFDGSARLEVLADAMPEVEPIVVETDGTRPVVVRRTDIASADDPRAVRLGLGANRIAQVDLEFDAAVLADLSPEVDLGQFWNDAELADLLPAKGNDAEDPGPQIDRAAELQAKWGTASGQLWAAGKQRLLVGDCTVQENIDRLRGGVQLDLLMTDPPYSSGGFQEAGRASGSIGTDAKVKRTILNDTLSTRGYQALMGKVLDVCGCGLMYVFTDWRMWVNLFDVSESKGFGVRNMIVWDKGSPGMGVGWRTQHELVLFATKTKLKFDNHKAVGNVIQAKRTGNELHPTEKPVELIETILRLTDWAETVLDTFCGSGTTLIACEKVGRRGYGLELDVNFAAVTLERLAGLGLTPELVSNA